MATVTGLTAARMQELANAFIVDGTVNEMGNLILTTAGNVEIDAGPIILYGTAGQYYRGDKQWATLDKNAVGLSNVDNVSILAGYIPKWLPNVAYSAGDLIISPMGELVKAKTALTASATYNTGSWAVVSLGESVVARTNLTRNPVAGVDATDSVTTAGGGTPTLSRITTGGPTVAAAFVRATAASAGWTYVDIRQAGSATNLVVPGVNYTSSAYIRSTMVGGVVVYIQWVDAGGAILSTSTSSGLGNNTANTWERFSLTAVAPANAVRAIAIFRVTGTTSAGTTVDGTGYLFEASDTLKPLFHGASTADTLTYAWTGTAHLSTSTATSTSNGFVPKWRPGVAYAANQQVVNPYEEIVESKTARTSGAVYNAAEAANWRGYDQVMMFGNSGFGWSGGSVAWDAGPLAVDASTGASSQVSPGANFASAGSLSGSLKFLEPGIYDIIWDNYTSAEPGNAGYRINSSGTWPGPIDNPNGVFGVGIKINGQTYWETKVLALGIRVPVANLEVRLVGLQMNASTNIPRVKVIKKASI